jgi:plastocyanin
MVVATFSGQGVAAHRWYPTMLVARRGDTVDLAVANPDKFNHQFELTGYDLSTPKLTPGASASLRFVADRTGVFQYHCRLPHNPATGDCTPDHDLMLGYLIVTD